VTYARWAKKGDANPIAFDTLTLKLVQDLRASGSLFARKFPSRLSAPVERWREIICKVSSPRSTHSEHTSALPILSLPSGPITEDMSGPSHTTQREGEKISSEGEKISSEGEVEARELNENGISLDGGDITMTQPMKRLRPN
jgi:hypothetical protein